jgi:hypothetical protein
MASKGISVDPQVDSQSSPKRGVLTILVRRVAEVTVTYDDEHGTATITCWFGLIREAQGTSRQFEAGAGQRSRYVSLLATSVHPVRGRVGRFNRQQRSHAS